MKIGLKKILPHVYAVAIFLVVAIFFCKPALEGLSVEQHDLIQWKGMAQDGFNYKEKHGDFPEWTNGMFSGMPAYNIAFESNANVPANAAKVLGLGLPEPFIYFFLCCITFYFLSQIVRVNSWIGIAGSLAFAYCSYNAIIISVGHHTKMMTIALMPALLASLLIIFQYRKYWIGGALTALFTSSVVVFNHLQMVYYLLIVIGIMTIAFAIDWIKKQEWKHLVSSAATALIAAAIGVLACAVNIFTTYDYSKESMRGGKANIVINDTSATAKAKASSGLDIDYAFRWSYGIPETFSLMVPNVNGGASKALSEESNFYQTLIEKVQSGQLDRNMAQQVGQLGNEYWGDQPGTSGPVYIGALICFLFILGLFVTKGFHKWWMLAACVVGILLAWGSNFMGFNEFMFKALPLYNKFRAPSQSLAIPQLLFPFLAILGLQELFYGGLSDDEKIKKLKNALYVVAGFVVLVVGYYFTATYSSHQEQQILTQVKSSDPSLYQSINDIMSAVSTDREELFSGDLIRSLAFIVIGLAIVFFAIKKKIKPIVASVLLIILVLFDLLPVSSRYLNEENYAEKTDTEAITYLSINNPGLYKTLQQVNQDPDKHFRVFNTTGDSFNDALTSAMVRSIGGYHPAKLSIYQDLIEYKLSKQSMNVFNMLDTKYFIVNGPNGIESRVNPDAYGAAWLVDTVQFADNPTQELQMLDSVNLRDVAIVQNSFKNEIGANFSKDSSSSIRLTTYDNDLIEYQINTTSPQLAVLSEIYYPRGWKAFVDGKETAIIKTDYALRGIVIPANAKQLQLKFEPRSYTVGRLTTTIASLLIIVGLIIGAFVEIRKNRQQAKA